MVNATQLTPILTPDEVERFFVSEESKGLPCGFELTGVEKTELIELFPRFMKAYLPAAKQDESLESIIKRSLKI